MVEISKDKAETVAAYLLQLDALYSLHLFHCFSDVSKH